MTSRVSREIRRIWRDERGMYNSLLVLIATILFIAIPLLMGVLYFGEDFVIRRELQQDVDAALLGAATQVEKTSYSYNGHYLWYYQINQTGGTTESNGTVTLSGPGSPVWSLVDQSLLMDLQSNPSGFAMSTAPTITLQSASFSQTVTDLPASGTSQTWTVPNTGYVIASTKVTFQAPALMFQRAINALYGSAPNPSIETITVYSQTTLKEPALEVHG